MEGEKNGKNTEAICRLHCEPDVNPFFLDKIHDISARTKGEKYRRRRRRRVSLSKEQLIPCEKLLKFATNVLRRNGKHLLDLLTALRLLFTQLHTRANKNKVVHRRRLVRNPGLLIIGNSKVNEQNMLHIFEILFLTLSHLLLFFFFPQLEKLIKKKDCFALVCSEKLQSCSDAASACFYMFWLLLTFCLPHVR